MQITDKNQVITLLSGINEQYKNNIVRLREANKEFEEVNWPLLTKKKYFDINGFPNLTADQKYEMTWKQIDEYNKTRENAFEEYSETYKTSYKEFISSKWIHDFKLILDEIINNENVLTVEQRELFENILYYTDWEKDFKVKTDILKFVLQLITWNYSKETVEKEEETEFTQEEQVETSEIQNENEEY